MPGTVVVFSFTFSVVQLYTVACLLGTVSGHGKVVPAA